MAEINFTPIELHDIGQIAEMPYAWDKLKNATILISGSSGFIGSHIIAVLNERNKRFKDNIRIIGLSRHEQSDCSWGKHMACDITQKLQIDGPIDYIIHLASNTHPEQYSTDPVGTITTNVFGSYNLLELAKRKKIKRFLLASSVEIYGNGSTEPMDESYCGYIDCNTARAGYNESKRVSESLCQSYILQYGVDCVIARLARVFGADRKNDTKALAQFMSKAVNGEDIILKSKGEQRFSYCYVMDAVSALLKILIDGVSGEAYNVAEDDESVTLGDYAKLIAGFADRRVVFDLENTQRGASAVSYALISSAKLKKIGWKPIYNVSDSMRKTYDILVERKGHK